MKFLKIYIFAVVLNSLGTVSVYGESSTKVAVVDVESILENSLAIGSIKKSINELSKTIENEIIQQEKEYKKRQQELLELQKTVSQEKFDSLGNKIEAAPKEKQELTKSFHILEAVQQKVDWVRFVGQDEVVEFRNTMTIVVMIKQRKN